MRSWEPSSCGRAVILSEAPEQHDGLKPVATPVLGFKGTIGEGTGFSPSAFRSSRGTAFLHTL